MRPPADLGVLAKHLISEPLLLFRHRVVEILESWHEPLQVLGMRLGDLFVGLHVLQGVHCRKLLATLGKFLIHRARILTHDFGEPIPLRLLGRGDPQLRMQLANMLIDTLLGCAGNGI